MRAFAVRVLDKMGLQRRWLANFASEAVKREGSAISVDTEARPVAGGFSLHGEKSFGCATGVADEYLVTARLAGTTDLGGVGLFLVARDTAGVDRQRRAGVDRGRRELVAHEAAAADLHHARKGARHRGPPPRRARQTRSRVPRSARAGARAPRARCP